MRLHRAERMTRGALVAKAVAGLGRLRQPLARTPAEVEDMATRDAA